MRKLDIEKLGTDILERGRLDGEKLEKVSLIENAWAETNLTKVSLIQVNLATPLAAQTTCMSDGSDLARNSLAQAGMVGAEVILMDTSRTAQGGGGSFRIGNL